MTKVTKVGFLLVTLLILILGILPVLVLLIEVGVHGFISAWTTSTTLRPALWTTLGSGLIAMLVILVLGGPTAWYLSRHAPPKTTSWAFFLVMIPLFMPPLVLGLVLAFVLGPDTAVGQALTGIGVSPTNSWFALVVAEVYEALPYFLITAWAGLRSLSPALEESALTLHRTPMETLRYVTLPLATPSLIAALALSWSRVVGAFGAVIILAYHPQGLPVAIWTGLEEMGLGQALPLALWLLVVGLPIPLAFSWKGRDHVASLR